MKRDVQNPNKIVKIAEKNSRKEAMQ